MWTVAEKQTQISCYLKTQFAWTLCKTGRNEWVEKIKIQNDKSKKCVIVKMESYDLDYAA